MPKHIKGCSLGYQLHLEGFKQNYFNFNFIAVRSPPSFTKTWRWQCSPNVYDEGTYFISNAAQLQTLIKLFNFFLFIYFFFIFTHKLKSFTTIIYFQFCSSVVMLHAGLVLYFCSCCSHAHPGKIDSKQCPSSCVLKSSLLETSLTFLTTYIIAT